MEFWRTLFIFSFQWSFFFFNFFAKKKIHLHFYRQFRPKLIATRYPTRNLGRELMYLQQIWINNEVVLVEKLKNIKECVVESLWSAQDGCFPPLVFGPRWKFVKDTFYLNFLFNFYPNDSWELDGKLMIS
jgi:hypothetical protein